MLKRRQVERWLRLNGFTQKGGNSGHCHFEQRGVKVSFPSHGRADMGRSDLASVLRALERLGYDRRAVVEELRAA